MYGITENGDTVRPQSADDLDDRETDVQEKGRLQIAGAAMIATAVPMLTSHASIAPVRSVSAASRRFSS